MAEGEMQETVAKNLERISTVEMRVNGMPAGVIDELVRATEPSDGSPRLLLAAEALLDTIDEDDFVFILTGAGGPPHLPKGETDGPMGAVALARALAIAADAKPILLTEERNIPPLEACVHACGFNNISPDELDDRRRAMSIVGYTESESEAEEFARDLFDRFDPVSIISVEKLGPNDEGVIHSITGEDFTDDHAKVEPLFDLAEDRDVLTIGIGDGGNEVGFGNYQEAIRSIQPYGEVCQCPCEGGVATSIGADHLVVGGTSNWGAYAIAAMLAFLSQNLDALHDASDEARMLEYAVMEGSNDGLYGRPLLMVDGTSQNTQEGMVSMMNDIISNGLETVDRDF